MTNWKESAKKEAKKFLLDKGIKMSSGFYEGDFEDVILKSFDIIIEKAKHEQAKIAKRNLIYLEKIERLKKVDKINEELIATLKVDWDNMRIERDKIFAEKEESNRHEK